MSQNFTYDEDFNLIPTFELEIHHEQNGVFVKHVPTDVSHTELFKIDEKHIDTVKRAISTLTYQVFIHRLHEDTQNTATTDKPVADVLTNLTLRVERLEHALRMR